MQQNELRNKILGTRDITLVLILIGVTSFVACTMLTPPSPFDRLPEPVGGYDAIEKNIFYPKEASEAGIEGSVVIYTFVDSLGRVTATIVLKGFPDTGFDEAAMDAIRKTPWKPAKKEGKPVGMWVKIPVVFSLGRVVQPVPIGGYDVIAKGIIYPDTALAAGIEDTMVVKIYVDKTGKVKEVTIIKGVPNTGLNSSVVAAIRRTHFKPGRFRGNLDGFWITISVNFRLDGIKVVPVNNTS